MTNRHRKRPESTGEPATLIEHSLEEVTEQQTISDVVDVAALQRRLPAGWGASVELVQSESESLLEAIRIERSVEDPQLLFVPAEMSTPSGCIEFYEQWQFDGKRTHLLTAESLSEAVRAAINWTHQRTN